LACKSQFTLRDETGSSLAFSQVEIYDFAGRLHLVEMEPGDIVYYESARCMHGRMKPLRGEYYVNLFSHYRPIGDPEWHTKSNPSGTTEQVHNIGTCSYSADLGRHDCTEISHEKVPYLSANQETVTQEGDLFEYWKTVSPSEEERQRTMDGAATSASLLPTSAMQPPPSERSEL
jgi:hypothetical protein